MRFRSMTSGPRARGHVRVRSDFAKLAEASVFRSEKIEDRLDQAELFEDIAAS
jgi:hypothetical protein